jgi:hypothetical protein
MLTELRKPLNGYFINEIGDVFSMKGSGRFGDNTVPDRPRMMAKRINKYGYIDVGLRFVDANGNRKKRMYEVHRLVAQYFIPNHDKLPQVNHKDGNKLNNHVSNLEWCTARYNVKHRVDNGDSYVHKGQSNPCAKLKDSDVVVIMRMYTDGGVPIRDIADKFKVAKTTINNIVYGYQWNHVTGLPCKKEKYRRKLGKANE